jgi:hypothetical protein
MTNNGAWYRQPESFIALAALIVSLSAAIVGIYEASLQRTHDRAEVWPHVEISTFIADHGAEVSVENTGVGPAIINSVVVSVDGSSRKNWDDVVRALAGGTPPRFGNTTVIDHALRGGEKVAMLSIATENLPADFWKWIARVSVSICYRSIFDDHWTVSDEHLGGSSTWRVVSDCPTPTKGIEF